jgi:hypothetical protein
MCERAATLKDSLTSRRLVGLVLFAAHFVGLPAYAQTDLAALANLNAPLEIVRFGETDTLRDFVGEYLGDPDLWPYVLQLNRIASPADVRPGLTLSLPVQQVRAADSALLESLQAIQSATAEGAQVFAPREIGDAIENRDNAVARREVGEWRQVVDLSNLSTLLAQEALSIAIAQRDRSAEAIVSDVQGSLDSSFKCNTQSPQGIGCCDGQTK